MTRPLWIWARPDARIDLDAIKRAKAALDLDFKIIPCDLNADAVVELSFETRVLAIGSPPPWIFDYWLLAEASSDEEWREALAWVLGDFEDWQATTVLDTVQATFGPGTREISADEQESETRMSNYLNYVE